MSTHTARRPLPSLLLSRGARPFTVPLTYGLVMYVLPALPLPIVLLVAAVAFQAVALLTMGWPISRRNAVRGVAGASVAWLTLAGLLVDPVASLMVAWLILVALVAWAARFGIDSALAVASAVIDRVRERG